MPDLAILRLSSLVRAVRDTVLLCGPGCLPSGEAAAEIAAANAWLRVVRLAAAAGERRTTQSNGCLLWSFAHL
jgi:hypothetical protein